MKKTISFDTYYFIIIAAMIVGFYTENWLPFIFFCALGGFSTSKK